MDNLAAHVQGLPEELYDCIYADVFTAPAGAAVEINKSYKPPVQLRVTRGSREQFALSYYSTTKFNIGGEWNIEVFTQTARNISGHLRVMSCWLGSVSKAHLCLVPTIHCNARVFMMEESKYPPSPRNMEWERFAKGFAQALNRDFHHLQPKLTHMRIVVQPRLECHDNEGELVLVT